MTTSETIKATESVLANATSKVAGWGRFIGNMLFFSPADDRIAPGRCLSFSLEMGGISVSYGSRRLSRIKIRANRTYPYEKGKYPTPENLSVAAVLAMNDLEAAGAQVTLVIPKAWVIIKKAEFPLVVKDNLFNVLSYELDRLTPFSSDRAFFDFRILAEEANRIEILLAAIGADRLSPYLEVLREKGILVTQVVVGSFALGTLSHYLQGGKDTLFAQIDAGGFEGGLIHKGKWKASFAGNFAESDEPSRVRTFADKIRPFVDEVKKKGGAPTVYIHPPLSMEHQTLLRDQLHAPVRIIGECDTKSPLPKASDAPECFSAAMGGILQTLWPRMKGMNLLDKGMHKTPKSPRALTVILLAVLIIVGFFRLISPLQLEEKRIAVIDREITVRAGEVRKIEALEKESEAVTKEITTISDFKSTHPIILAILKEMTQVLPNNVWLSRARITESTVEIEGYATSATDIVPRLEASPYFKNVEFTSPTFRDARLNADRFLIKMEIEGPSDKKGGK